MSNKIKKGDKVEVLVGKDIGKQAVVEKLLTKKGLVYLPGINTYKRHIKKQGQVEGGIIDIVKPLNLSKVGLVCPSCKKVTRVGFSFSKDNKKIRVCKKCKKEI